MYLRTFLKNSIKFMARPKIAWKLKGGNPKIDIYISCQKSWKESMNEKATFLNDESRDGFMNFNCHLLVFLSRLIIDIELAWILVVYKNNFKKSHFSTFGYLNFCAKIIIKCLGWKFRSLKKLRCKQNVNKQLTILYR